MTELSEVIGYINRIRNGDRKRYAIAYFDYLRRKTNVYPDRGHLSVMASQAVRMQIDALAREEREDRDHE